MDNAGVRPLFDGNKIKDQVIQVLTRPADFFRTMPKTGGFQEPLVFVACLAVVAGVIQAVRMMLLGSLGGAITSLIAAPVLVVIGSFIVAAIAFVVFNILGSRENYETSYRCMAYCAAVYPLTMLLHLIPYLGGIVGAVYSFWLAVIISTEVHKIDLKKARLVWGIIFGLLGLFGLNAEYQARKFANMTPEEAGRAMSEFFRGMEKGNR